MERKIAWMLLSESNRTSEKIKKLEKNFEKAFKDVNLYSDAAKAIENDIIRARELGCEVITYLDPIYPEALRNISFPPPYLYVRGDVSLLNFPLKATIVGSREASLYGINTASNFAFELASNNVLVVSGGAKGIDTAAIKGAMKAGGRTIVVIGTGIDIDYPKENAALFANVVKSGGLIVSEFPLGTGPFGRNFPIRNRIMTALGDSVVVVEAGERSGALISATHALEQGKTLYAVPGNIDSPNSQGTNALLRDGALFATSGSDILFDLMEKESEKYREARDYEWNKAEEAEEKEEHKKTAESKTDEGQNMAIGHLTPIEAAVVNAVKSGKDTYEEILEFCACEPNKLTSVLTIMEIKGIIKLAFGNRYKVSD